MSTDTHKRKLNALPRYLTSAKWQEGATPNELRKVAELETKIFALQEQLYPLLLERYAIAQRAGNRAAYNRRKKA